MERLISPLKSVMMGMQMPMILRMPVVKIVHYPFVVMVFMMMKQKIVMIELWNLDGCSSECIVEDGDFEQEPIPL